MFKRFIRLLLLLCWSLPASAQFFLNGDAVQTNDTCYQLTFDRNFSVGSLWNPNKIDLRKSFDVVVRLNLGCKDANGADGMVFGFQPISTSIGTGGEGIGFQNIVPSLGIEFDTWQNANLNDPPADHVAIIRNGIMNHGGGGTLAGPVSISPSNPNVEDCQFHEVRIAWDAQRLLLEVFFDCNKRLSYQGDIVRDIFNNDPFVFWGFTSATGGANNIHQICFTYTTFLDQLQDVVVCPGGQAPLRVRGGSKYRWTPEEGLSNPFSPTTFAAPQQTTTYMVEIQDECGRTFFDEVTVSVAGNPVFFDLGPDTAICVGDALQLDVTTPTARYLWLDGNQQAVRRVSEPGYYEVTVTRTDTFCTSTDAISITHIQYPTLELGQDTQLCTGQDLLLRASFPGAITRWQDGLQSDSLRVNQPGRYTAFVSNVCGEAVDAVTISYDDCDEAFLPSAFSPNDDGINDRIGVLHNGDVVRVKRFQIFSRWGELVFERLDFLPSGEADGWDGRHRGRELPEGVFVYYLEIDFRDGTTQQRSGEIYLLRGGAN